ncbi:hypothetical protein [Hymenobacter psychrophilus]|uniref:Uncharacterized protein n=1 Tax=Hymenobacter psychrophilus TaxID=651662 RepID=A0A1H3FJX8_9BACT|nr:hypothetical protein [Hymenobacter psychrophilus]SDX90688.1 hypothetical protein SAMN04488069_10488 [Hymenobacter psychrophilus]
MKPTESYPTQLRRFLCQVLLPAVPRPVGWALGLIGFSALNLLFVEELWPHFPQAEKWFGLLLVSGLGTLPWLAAATAGRVQRRMRGLWWRGIWQLATIGTYVVAVLLSMLLFVGFLLLLANNQW